MLISTVGGNHFTILPAVYKDSNVSKSSPTTILFVVLGLFFFFLIEAILVGIRSYLIVGLI